MHNTPAPVAPADDLKEERATLNLLQCTVSAVAAARRRRPRAAIPLSTAPQPLRYSVRQSGAPGAPGGLIAQFADSGAARAFARRLSEDTRAAGSAGAQRVGCWASVTDEFTGEIL